MSETSPLIRPLAEALAHRGYDQLTPVQETVTQPEYSAADLLVSAQTGSGKTVGFGLAIAPTILDAAERFGPAGAPLALIVAPTRELALQVRRELSWLYEMTGATLSSCVGGMDMRDERRALDRGAHIVVGTPGRLRDHIQRGSLDMGAIRAVVLDEADEMLDLGFREDLEFILAAAPEDRRTLMFSATVPKAIATLAQKYQKDAVRVSTAGERSQHADIDYRAMQVATQDVENAIVNVLRFYEAQNAIIFCNTRATVNRLTTRLSNRSFSVVALSGELSQSERTHALQAMRDGRARVCVATDVAARGIDLPNLELVIHAELPSNGETLLHRSGRTGRAGRKGVSALIVPKNARKKAENILRFAKVTATWVDAPSADAVRTRDEERLLADPVWSEDIGERDGAFARRLLDLHGAERIAAAFVRAWQGRHSAPEELAAPGAVEGPRPAFGPSRWFSISLGRADKAEPRWLLPMLCRAGNISREDVGAIRVQETETFVEVLAARAPAMLAAIGPEGRLEGGAVLRALDAPPFGGPAQHPTSEPPRKKGPKYASKRDAGDDVAKTPAKKRDRDRSLPAPVATEHGLLTEAPAPKAFKPAGKKPHRKGGKPAGVPATGTPRKDRAPHKNARPGKTAHRKGGMAPPKRGKN
ncbi:DEAD/DEAH box helicase [Defluviimonas aestuarii]|uniref:DEAD/DEAH box helicase n=1 Tax=Albidovulum aestuarii TaxID=1130726 RepID=UPI00249CA0AD|nr:DEAD/DEAH box helicase [Defluviimonas aestuarii]MDI3336786.1 DEAD/DEAH box helicase [Defluviimonas aestuarii]